MQHKTDRITYSNLCIREETRGINNKMQRPPNINKCHIALSAMMKIIHILHTIVPISRPPMKKDVNSHIWEVAPTAPDNTTNKKNALATSLAPSTPEKDTIHGYARDMLQVYPYDN